MATATKKETIEKTHEERINEYYNERVPVFVPRPDGSKENAITVTHNGKNYQILYDTEVMVPRFIALIIEESKRNAQIARDNVERLIGTDKQIGEF